MTAVDFRYWDSVDPASFLDHDWENPSRAWATQQAIACARGGTLLEIGPGPGVDYERYFRGAVLSKQLTYSAYEGSENLCASLQSRFPESQFHWAKIADLQPLTFDVVYARHVMEHQPALEPALGLVLGAARHFVVLTWYRPPGPSAFHEIWEGVHCQTYQREAVMQQLSAAGFGIVESQTFVSDASSDEAWVLARV